MSDYLLSADWSSVATTASRFNTKVRIMVNLLRSKNLTGVMWRRRECGASKPGDHRRPSGYCLVLVRWWRWRKCLLVLISRRVFALTDPVGRMSRWFRGNTYLQGNRFPHDTVAPSSEGMFVRSLFFHLGIGSFHSCSISSTVTWGWWPGRTMPLPILVPRPTCFLCVEIEAHKVM